MKDEILALHVTPGASRSEIIGWVETAGGGVALKLRISAPPEDGKANKALIAFLAKTWGVRKDALTLVSGEGSRHKRLKIHDDACWAQLPPR